MSESTIRKRNLIFFPLGTIGRDMLYCLVTNFLLTYILFTKSLTNAQLAAVTAIMVGARIFDALNDPIMGNIIERTRSRWGRFKPWLVIGILSTSVVVYTVFNTNLTGWKFIWLFGFFYFSYSITYTMHDISYWGMIPALTSDAHARDQYTSRAVLFAGIGSTIASVLIPILTMGSGALGGSTATAFGRVALIACILAPLFLCFTIFGVHEERQTERKEPAERIGIANIFKTLTRNDQLMWVALIFLIQQVGGSLVVSGMASTYIYLVHGYSGGLYSTFTTVGTVPTVVLMLFYPAISKKIGRKRLMKYMACLAVTGYAVMLVSGLLMPHGMVKFWFLVIGYAFSEFGQTCYCLILMVSILNTVEYNEMKFGQRDEAIITSLRPFITKMASAVVAVLVSASYMLFGVTGITNQISDLETKTSQGLLTESEKLNQIGQILQNVSPGQGHGLLLCITVLPCLLMLTAFLLYRRHYKLDEEEYDRLCRELEERRKQKKE